MKENQTRAHNEKDMVQQWKDEYNTILVPKEARERIEAGISRARLEQTRRDYMKTFKQIGISAAAVVVTFGVAVNASPAIANAMDQIPVIGNIAKVFTISTYTNQKGNVSADVKVPNLDGNAAVNADIDAYAKQLIAQYEKELSAQADEKHYALESNYEVVSDGTRYVSIQINTMITEASGAEFVKIFTVDKTTGEAVTLNDLVKDKAVLDNISANILTQMEEEMKADDSKSYFTADDPDGFTGLTGEESFYLNEAGELVIVFSEYDVAPGYMGSVSFVIPNSVSQLG